MPTINYCSACSETVFKISTKQDFVNLAPRLESSNYTCLLLPSCKLPSILVSHSTGGCGHDRSYMNICKKQIRTTVTTLKAVIVAFNNT